MKFYLLVAAFVAVFIVFVYLYAYRTGAQKCHAQIAENTIKTQNNIIKLQDNINAEAFNRGADDIRNILYEKYTIAE